MTLSQRPDIAPPDGADLDPDYLNDWQPTEDGQRTFRLVWSQPFERDSGLDMRVVVVQFDDGSIADGEEDPDDAPLVYIGGGDFHPDDARAIAASITRAADLADTWTQSVAGDRRVDGTARDVTRRQSLSEGRIGYRIFDQMRSPEAVEAGRHPGCERELSVVDASTWTTLFTAFQRPEGGWFIDVETAAIKLVGWKVLGHSVHGFSVRTDKEALDWMKFLGALATREGASE